MASSISFNAGKDLAVAILVAALKIPSSRLVITDRAAKSGVELVLPNKESVHGSLTIAEYLLSTARKLEVPNATYFSYPSELDNSQIRQWSSYSLKTTVDLLAGRLKDTEFETIDFFLSTRTYLATNYFSIADIFMYSALYTPFRQLTFGRRDELVHVMRYFDLVQNVVIRELGVNPEKDLVPIKLVDIELDTPFVPKVKEPRKPKETKEAAKAAEAKKPEQIEAKKSKAEVKSDEKKVKKDNPESKPKEKKPEAKKEKPSAAPANTTPTIDPSKIDLRVGRVIQVSRHPDADSLYVEQVDVGEEKPRTVVSGLVKYMEASVLQDALVVLVCNLKPAKMRGIESQAMVLAATSPDGTTVELVQPPTGTKPGEKVHFGEYTGEPEAQLNPKKKIWETIQPRLITDNKTHATYVSEDNVVSILKTSSGGVCKVKTIVGGGIK